MRILEEGEGTTDLVIGTSKGTFRKLPANLDGKFF